MKLSELRQKKGELAAEIRKFAEIVADRPLTSEERANFEQANRDYDEVRDRVETLERHDAIRSELEEERDAFEQARRDRATENRGPANPLELREQAIQGWLLATHGEDVPDELRAAMTQTGLGARAGVDVPLLRTRELRALEAGVAGEGGATVPPGFLGAFEKALLAFGGMRGVSTIIRTPDAQPLKLPSANDTGNVGEIVDEEGDASTEADPTFGAVTLNGYKFSSKVVKVSFELLRDSILDLASELGMMLGERIGRYQNTMFTTGAGSGSTQPRGAVLDSVQAIETASGTAITSDELINAFHALGRAYRVNARWMMADAIAAKVRLLKNAVDGTYLWQPGLVAGQPDVLLGKPVTINDDVDDTIAAGTKPILFGDFSKYHIRDVASLRLRRLDELFALTDQVAFIAFLTSDGALRDVGTNPVKHVLANDGA